VHTYIGDDFTGDGTREYPFKSTFKANQKSGGSYIVFRGVINESVYSNKDLIGDDINQNYITSNFNSVFYRVINCTIDKIRAYYNEYIRLICTLSSVIGLDYTAYVLSNILFKQLCYVTPGSYGGPSTGIPYNSTLTSLTIDGWRGSYSNSVSLMKNCIVIKQLNLVNLSTGIIVKNTIFPSDCIFMFENTIIPSPIWTNNSKSNFALLRSAFILAGLNYDVAFTIMPVDSFGNETCRVILEERNGGTSANIFNLYDSLEIIDFSLNSTSSNEALYSSELGGYVGCFKPATSVTKTMLNPTIDVNADGNDTVNAGTLVRINDDQTIDFNTVTAQIWNRIKSNTTINIPNGIKFNGLSAMSTDGSAFGYYYGKHQTLMDGTALVPGDVLEANSIYKVCNVNRDIYSAAIFNGTQYLPDYFFKTGTDVLDFLLLNDDSGTVVKKVLATPMESIEIIPYDDAVTPSINFPKFSCPLFGNVQMLFHKIGDNIDKPVLFSEVENYKIAYYSNWAVTNADQEFVTLATDTVNFYYKTPVLKYLRIELNGHFNADYDQ